MPWRPSGLTLSGCGRGFASQILLKWLPTFDYLVDRGHLVNVETPGASMSDDLIDILIVERLVSLYDPASHLGLQPDMITLHAVMSAETQNYIDVVEARPLNPSWHAGRV